MGLFDQKSPTYSLFYIYRVDRSLEGLEIIKKNWGVTTSKKKFKSPWFNFFKKLLARTCQMSIPDDKFDLKMLFST